MRGAVYPRHGSDNRLAEYVSQNVATGETIFVPTHHTNTMLAAATSTMADDKDTGAGAEGGVDTAASSADAGAQQTKAASLFADSSDSDEESSKPASASVRLHWCVCASNSALRVGCNAPGRSSDALYYLM